MYKMEINDKFEEKKTSDHPCIEGMQFTLNEWVV